MAASTGCLLTGVLTGNAREKIHRRGCRWMQKVVIFRYSCADFEESDALDAAALALHRWVNVELQRRFNVRVTEQLADAFYIRACFHTSRRKRVPQRMKAAVPNAAAPQKHRELILAGARINRSVCTTGHQIGIWRELRGNPFQQKQQLWMQRYDPLGAVAFRALHQKLGYAMQRDALYRPADMERPRKKINIAYAQRAGLTDAKSRMKRQHYGKADFL